MQLNRQSDMSMGTLVCHFCLVHPGSRNCSCTTRKKAAYECLHFNSSIHVNSRNILLQIFIGHFYYLQAATWPNNRINAKEQGPNCCELFPSQFKWVFSLQQNQMNTHPFVHITLALPAFSACRSLTSDSAEEKWLQFLCMRWYALPLYSFPSSSMIRSMSSSVKSVLPRTIASLRQAEQKWTFTGFHCYKR